ncbi:MAG: DapH/DapD/GlmU-related protein [Gaiellaceae bacterium]
MTRLTSSALAPGLQLGENVELGANLTIGAHVVIHAGVVVGDGCVIQDGAVLGKVPTPPPTSKAEPEPRRPLVLEPGAVVCCGAVVCEGARIGARAMVGDHAFVRERAEIGSESSIGHGGAIGRGVRIGERARLMNSVIVAPGSVLEDDVFFGPLVVVANDLTMGRHAHPDPPAGITARRACRVGASAVLLPGVEIGAEAVVGASALVTKDVPARTVVVGIPARVLRKVRQDELFGRWTAG